MKKVFVIMGDHGPHDVIRRHTSTPTHHEPLRLSGIVHDRPQQRREAAITVPEAGLEPACSLEQTLLRRPCKPIPPFRHILQQNRTYSLRGLGDRKSVV